MELVHFQLTKSCNLRCWFCGQWGKQGFFSDAAGEAMTYDDWLEVARQLVDYREKTGVSPDILLWGGEPLLCPFFEELVRVLRGRGFRLGLVTNGTLIHRYAALLKEAFARIYVSLDGDRELHNRIRGAGVFDRVAENLELLRGKRGVISLMTVLSREVLPILPQLPKLLAPLNWDELLLQELIALSQEEAEAYADWLRREFHQEAGEIYSWVGEGVDKSLLSAALAQVLEKRWPKPVKYLPHGVAGHPCKAPGKHLHIAWNGQVLFCTDFYDFSPGNVKQEPIMSIWSNELSRRFREQVQEGACVTCRHCSWQNSNSFKL